MDELLKSTLIAAERVCGIKVRQTLSADRTEVVFVQRIVIREGSAARSAEEFSLKQGKREYVKRWLGVARKYGSLQEKLG